MQKEEHVFSLLGLRNRIKKIERYEKAARDSQEMQRRPLHHWWWNCPQMTDIQKESRSVKNLGLSTFKKCRSGNSKKSQNPKLWSFLLSGFVFSEITHTQKKIFFFYAVKAMGNKTVIAQTQPPSSEQMRISLGTTSLLRTLQTSPPHYCL